VSAPTSSVAGFAEALRRAGLSTVAIREDGSKAPTVPWADFRRRLPTTEELRRMHSNGAGIAVIGGRVSGNLEVLDFDAPDLVAPFRSIVQSQAPGLIERLVISETPGGGQHLLYRHRDDPQGNQKLAQELRADAQGQERPHTLIETRGEGGYAILPGSPAACHPSGRPYRLLHGDLLRIPTISAEERAILLTSARALTRYVPAPGTHDRTPASSGVDRGARPGDAFNAAADWATLLEPAGWRHVYSHGGVTAWRRPGKERGISATSGYGGTRLLYVFSSNAAPFEPERTYSAFEAYALLHHAGDRRAAARDLAAHGYGQPRPAPVPAPPPASSGEAATAGAIAEDWPEPAPLGFGPLPAFPIDALPSWQGAMARALATALQVPIDLTAMLSLAAVAATVANTVQVLVKPGYVEPVNIWVLVPLGPGNRKSAAVRALVQPLAAWQRRRAEEMSADIAEKESAAKIARAALERAEQQAAKAVSVADRRTATAEALELARAAAAATVPHAPRILAGDVTAERLVQLLAQHGGRLAIMSPEGTIFSLMEGRYSSGIPNIDVYLNAHAGDMIDVQRVGREPDFVDRPALTLGIAPQPPRLAHLGQVEGFRESGLLARFLYAIPTTLLGDRDRHAMPVPIATLDAYERALDALLALQPATDEHGKPTPQTLVLSPDAFAAWDAFGETIEPELHPTRAGARFAHIADWASKLEGATARIAALLHMAEHVGDWQPWVTPISGETMRAARNIGLYLIDHALTAFALMGGMSPTSEAEGLLNWIKDRDGDSFSAHDMWSSVRRRFDDQRERMDEPLALLSERDYIRERPIEPKAEPSKGGRPASKIYDVNPKIRTQNPQNLCRG